MDSYKFTHDERDYQFVDRGNYIQMQSMPHETHYADIATDSSAGIRALLRELTTARTALAEATRERDKYKPLAIDFGQQLDQSGKRIVELKAENTRLRAEIKALESRAIS